jgi:TonB family protein
MMSQCGWDKELSVIELAATAIALLEKASVVGSLIPDYPEEALAKNEEGKVTVALIVAADGKPSSCKVTIPSTSTALNESSCKFLLEQARYPATKSAQLRVKTQTIDWRIPPPNPISTVKTGVVVNFSINDRGEVSNCKEQVVGEYPQDEFSMCRDVAERGGLSKVIESKLSFNSNAFIRIFIDTIQSGPSSSTINIVYTKNSTLLEALFDVTPAGFVNNCRTIFLDPIFPAEDICLGFSKKHPEFKADKMRKSPQKMRLFIDTGIIPAQATKAQ